MSVLCSVEQRAAKVGVTMLTLVAAGVLFVAALVVMFSAMAGNYTPMLVMTLPVLLGFGTLCGVATKSSRLAEIVALARLVVILLVAASVCLVATLFALVGVSVAGPLADAANSNGASSVIAVIAFFFVMFGCVPFLNHAYEMADFKNQHVRREPPKQLGALFWWVLASFPVAVFWAVLWGVLAGAAIVTPVHW